MKKRTGLLIITFLAFYAILHLGRYLPDLVNGKFSLVDERSIDIKLLSGTSELVIACLFTCSTYLSLHQFFPNKKHLQMAMAIGACFLACFFLQYADTKLLSADPVRLSRFFRAEILYDAFYVVFAITFYFIRHSQFLALQHSEKNLQNRNAELAFLRSQINPHFLFNNLNNIYSLVYHHSEQSLAAISGLSELLRYMLYDKSETITLIKEIEYLEKYIQLEQLRFENPSLIKFEHDQANKQVTIAPLLLLPFIENAFKHGAICFTHCWLQIKIYSTVDGVIFLNCINEIGQKHKDPTGGIGISNVRKRLELLYPGAYELDVHQQDGQFKVTLRLENYQHSPAN